MDGDGSQMKYIVAESLVPTSDSEVINASLRQFDEQDAAVILRYVAERVEEASKNYGGDMPFEFMERMDDSQTWMVLGVNTYDQESDTSWYIQVDLLSDNEAADRMVVNFDES
jgi:hypothetical protein